ncbi:MAG: hypothetical protein B9S37_10385 [Verrucomicrobiia bacterium Tous-C3TDCM]|nr:MAG: hypothetical protein B9S37_10385 [Verrucomicrobiae bacterium Tous-C3TDCM]PAZ05506.1 MAG: hypothetical protein CAK88_08345 [Verrucomicrobiae bacterium AMD-G2]
MRFVAYIFPIFCSILFAAESDLAKHEPAPENTVAVQPEEKAEEKPAARPEASVKKLADGTMQIGDIIFDPKTRQVRVPCTVNMNEGLLEFAVVHENGKIHESLLITKASALHINIAMKLLRYVASEELYAIEKERGVLSDQFPEVEEKVRKAARVSLSIEWQHEGKAKKVPISDWIMHTRTTKPMSTEPWVYGGSMMYEGHFVAEQNGDIAAIFVSRGSLFLYPGKDNSNDEMWLANTKRIPPQGTSVFFLIEPSKL